MSSDVRPCSCQLTRTLAGTYRLPVRLILSAAILLLVPVLAIAQRDSDADAAFLPSPVRTVSTVPANGDVNPYGVAFVPSGFHWGAGPLRPGDILVANFNNSKNLQGTGTTIVRVPRNSNSVSTFFKGTPPLGLSTALGVLRNGMVVVGNFPTSDGTCATGKAGSLLVISNTGKLLGTLTDPHIQGPWDMALVDHGGSATAFVSNALTGTVVRLELTMSTSTGLAIHRSTEIASGYRHRCDPVALVVAPTGLVYDSQRDALYVASTDDNAVFRLDNAAHSTDNDGPGVTIYRDQTHLHGPLGMVMAPNGHLIVSNSDVINPDPKHTSELTEFTILGQFIKQLSVDPAAGGSFGLDVQTNDDQSTFAAVDDNTSTLIIWTLNVN